MLEILTVDEGLKYIDDTNADLKEIFEAVRGNTVLKLIKLKYFYCDALVHQGNFKLPPQIIDEISLAELNIDYCCIPLTFLLNKSCEVYLGSSERIMPLSNIAAGNFFGASEVTSWLFDDPRPGLWNVTAGGRSAFMLPSITDQAGHRRLKQYYSFEENAPQTLLSQANIFAKINRASPQPWCIKVLVFTKDWFMNPDIRERLLPFIFKLGWKQSQRLKDQITLDYLSEVFGHIIKKRRITIPAVILDKIKHLLMIADSTLPGFAPVLDDAIFPLENIQKAYLDHYQLKQYAPIILQSKFLSSQIPVYYFLNYPYFSSAYKKGLKTLSGELRLTQKILQNCLSEFKKTTDPRLFNHIEKVKYNYFYPESRLENILSTEMLPIHDKSWLQNGPVGLFPASAAVLSGCIKLSY